MTHGSTPAISPDLSVQFPRAQRSGYRAGALGSIELLNPDELRQAAEVAGALHRAWKGWLDAMPPRDRSASGLSRALEVDRTTCQRLVHAIRKGPPGPGVLARVPGVPGLRQLLEAGAGRVGAEVHEAAEASVEAFARLVEDLAGSQSRLIRRLDATLGATDAGREGGGSGDEAGERARLFEAAARLTGRSSDLWVAVYLYVPDPEDPKRMLVPRVYGLLGHRATPDAVPLVIQNFGSGPKGADAGAEAFGSGEVGSTGLVREFSTDPGSLVKAAAGDGLLVQRVDADERAIGEPIDLMLHSAATNPHPRLRDDGQEHLWALIHFPARAMLLDAWLPEAEARGSIPSAGVHLWGPDFRLDDRPGWKTRFPSSPRLEVLGRGLGGADSPLHARHRELTRWLFERAGVDPNQYCGFRCSTPYPIWRAGYCVTFDFGTGNGGR